MQRKRISLNGEWKMLIDPAGLGVVKNYHLKKAKIPRLNFLRNFKYLRTETVKIPCCWNTLAEKYRWYEGGMWFFREFSLPGKLKDRKITLNFEAVNYYCEVYLNGDLLGRHKGGYTPFEFDLGEFAKRNGNFLAVYVDNRQHLNYPCQYLGWYNFGGIYRDVEIVISDLPKISWLAVYPHISETEARLSVRTQISGRRDISDEYFILKIEIFSPDGKLLREVRKKLKAPLKTMESRTSIAIDSPSLWSPDSPELYSIRAATYDLSGNLRDSVLENFGIREVKVENASIYLNGKKIFLKGIAKHEEDCASGRTVDRKLVEKDFKLSSGAHANWLRLAHYPHSRHAAEIADRTGMLLWVEVPCYWWPGPGSGRAGCTDEFKEQSVRDHRNQLREMVRRDVNHPSVIFWGVANEIHSETPHGFEILKASKNEVEKWDDSRIITFASWGLDPEVNIGLELFPVICFNQYYGWYKKGFSEFEKFLGKVHEKYPEKPVMISEFGAGAVPGRKGGKCTEWSEEYQAAVIKRNIEFFFSNRDRFNIAGFSLWALFDFLDPTREYNIFQNGFNNKGILDPQRRPKIAYETLKKILKNMW